MTLTEMLKVYGHAALIDAMVRIKAPDEAFADVVLSQTAIEFTRMFHYVEVNGRIFKAKK